MERGAWCQPMRWIHNIYFDTPALSCFYIKAPATSMKSVREAAHGFCYRPARFSKYTAGMELSLPHRVSA